MNLYNLHKSYNLYNSCNKIYFLKHIKNGQNIFLSFFYHVKGYYQKKRKGFKNRARERY